MFKVYSKIILKLIPLSCSLQDTFWKTCCTSFHTFLFKIFRSVGVPINSWIPKDVSIYEAAKNRLSHRPIRLCVLSAASDRPIIETLVGLYTPCPEKMCHYIFGYNFAKCLPIFKTLSPTDLSVNFGKEIIKHHATPQTRRCTTSWNICAQKSQS